MFTYGQTVNIKNTRLYGQVAEVREKTAIVRIEGHTKTGNAATWTEHPFENLRTPRRALTAPDVIYQNAYDYIPAWANLPLLYATEKTPLEEKTLIIKLFNPTGGQTWYLAEYDPRENIAFGYVTGLYMPEWGNIPLDELAKFRGRMRLAIERDLYFKPCKVGEL